MVSDPWTDARQIAGGHAWDNHKHEFSEITTIDQFAEVIFQTMTKPSVAKLLSRGRVAFWNDALAMLVIRDPENDDLGTAFKPSRGRSYFDSLR